MIVLPTNKVPATSMNPQYLILYGLPKLFGPLNRNIYRKNA